MSERLPPEPVKFFIAVLGRDEELIKQALTELCAVYGAVDLTSPTYEFTHTSYYAEEMGAGLNRYFFAFEKLGEPQELAPFKLLAAQIEEKLGVAGKRTINLDPGFLDYNKIVLASFKNGGQKIYLRDGVFADMVLMYTKGHFQAFAWTFPDFGTGRYEKFLLELRRRYKAQRLG